MLESLPLALLCQWLLSLLLSDICRATNDDGTEGGIVQLLLLLLLPPWCRIGVKADILDRTSIKTTNSRTTWGVVVGEDLRLPVDFLFVQAFVVITILFLFWGEERASPNC